MPKTVSIIIRGKNEEDWLGLCLKSIHEQTFKDFEVIYVDNESDDASIQIAKEYDVDKITPEEWKLLDVTDYKKNSEKAKQKWLLGVRKHMLGKIEELLRMSELLQSYSLLPADVDRRRNNLSEKEKGRRRTSPNIRSTIEKLGGKKKRSRKKKRKKKRKKTKRKRN